MGIVILPLYLGYMGAETYGLVSFFTMLQAWFNLLDMGLTPTVARETARLKGNAADTLNYRRLLRVLQIIFMGVAFLGAGLMLKSASFIAIHWLNIESLKFNDVELALKLIGLSIAIRWISGLYKGCIIGAEKMTWLAGFNAVAATSRFILALPVLIWIGSSAFVFFAYQLIVSIIELTVLAFYAHQNFPKVPLGQKIGWTPIQLLPPINAVLKFSFTIAFTSAIWILVTQIDKLLLSKLLPLHSYGYFSLAVLAASSVTMISSPISVALLPRLSKMHAERNDKAMISLYRNAMQTIGAIVIPISILLAFFAEQILWVWTGDDFIATQFGPILRLYSIGNGFMAMSSFPYYLQFAKGDLRLHFIGNLIFLILLIPLMIWTTFTYGAKGAGYTWVSMNAAYFVIWTPVVHKRLLGQLKVQWIVGDLGRAIICSGFAGFLMLCLSEWPRNRVYVLGILTAFGIILLMMSVFALSSFRQTFKKSALKLAYR